MHKNCFGRCHQPKSSMNKSITGPFCRIEWKNIRENTDNQNGYLNFVAQVKKYDSYTAKLRQKYG